MIKKIINKLLNLHNTNNYKNSYSQYGEDQIIIALLYLLDSSLGTYIDIGANHPYRFNNTVLLSQKGFKGINIEPDPVNFRKLQKARPSDINLNIGVSNVTSKLKYYRFTDSVYNTFSKTEYENILKKPNIHALDNMEIAVKTYNEIVETYLNKIAPTILFIDTEGLDEIIIDAIDFTRYGPDILCIETFSYGSFSKDMALIKKITAKGYTIHADTFVNTIFLKTHLLPFKSK